MPLLEGFWTNALLSLRGASRWKLTQATVYTYRWRYHPGSEAPSYSHELTYSYEVDEAIYSGWCKWADNDGESSFHKGDGLEVLYDPKHPRRSYFPDKQNIQLPKYVAITCLAFAIAVLTIAVFSTRH